ncbi:MFS transporter [Streptomyces sp. NPDC089919]|uniref:MFS transporter n=1 Tax=Streptomyces sp. NPDC089919 TaxID=3155188 RepID=UPI00342EB963
MTLSPTAPAPAPRRGRPLLRDADFRRFWTADAVSQAGTAVTLLALPLTAIGTLGATPFQAGLLVACEYLGFLLVGLPAGAWLDRVRHRPVLVGGDLLRAALLVSVPVAALLDRLGLVQLYVVALGMSVCTVFFDVAHQSHLPQLVAPEELVAANVTLEATRSTVGAGGPGAAGALVAAVTAPVALAFDALSFLLSALCLSRIRRPEAAPAQAAGGTRLRTEIAEGLRFVLGDRELRAITLAAALSNLWGTVGASMLLVLLAGELDLSPFLCSLVFVAEAVGGLLGALLVTRVTGRLGEGRAMCASVITGAALWLAAVACFRPDGRFAVAVLLQGLGWTAFMTFKVTSVAVRQRRCPAPLLGRVNATHRFLVWGVMPLGALLGGVLGQWLGARPALWTGALGELGAVLPLLCSPLRTSRDRAR